MKMSGEATLRAGVDEVYAALNDPAVLVRTIPGCQRLEQVGDNAYRATIVAGVASIKGTFDGDVRLSDFDAPHSFTLHVSGVGAPGTVSATARVTLTPADETGTLLSYAADATIGGMIGGVGQRMITGVARKTASEFFAAVDRELAPTSAPVAVSTSPAGAEPALSTVSAPASGPAATPVAAPAVGLAAGPAVGQAWSAPVAVPDAARQRVRDLVAGAVFGVVVALLGVVVGAIVVSLR